MLPLGKKLDLPLACEVKMFVFLSCYCRAEKYWFPQQNTDFWVWEYWKAQIQLGSSGTDKQSLYIHLLPAEMTLLNLDCCPLWKLMSYWVFLHLVSLCRFVPFHNQSNDQRSQGLNGAVPLNAGHVITGNIPESFEEQAEAWPTAPVAKEEEPMETSKPVIGGYKGKKMEGRYRPVSEVRWKWFLSYWKVFW